MSAYALFFRDTQAAIKGQNPNASFGEVSKIVASMWDGLDSEHKSVSVPIILYTNQVPLKIRFLKIFFSSGLQTEDRSSEKRILKSISCIPGQFSV